MNKIIQYDAAARDLLLQGVKEISKAVRVTLGPSGKNVLIRQKGDQAPFATKDGVTVAAHISSKNEISQLAIESVQQVANAADGLAGDGTTTATILTEAIFTLGSVVPKEGINLLDLKKGIDLYTRNIIKELKELSTPCKDLDKLKEVALISSNGDEEISQIVIDAYKVAGNQGVVNIKRSRTHETYLTTIEGMNLPTGYLSPYFVTDLGADIVEFDNPYIYMTNEKIDSVTDNLNHLLSYISQNQKSLLIICKDIDISVLGMLVENKTKGILRVAVCKAPGFGEEQNDMLRDLGTVMGKFPFLENEGIDFNEISLEKEDDIKKYIPQSTAVLLTKDRLSIKGPKGLTEEEYDLIEKAKETRAQMLSDSLTKKTNEYERSIIQTRISRLRDGIAYINIGAIGEMDYIEKQHRIQDSLYAVKSAAEEGIIAGGGTALLFLSRKEIKHKNKSVLAGMNVVRNAIREPFIQILNNVGIFLKKPIFDSIKENYNYGIDARTGEFEYDMIKSGIIDPVKVTRVALENAAAVAGMLLTTECVIVDDDVYTKEEGLRL